MAATTAHRTRTSRWLTRMRRGTARVAPAGWARLLLAAGAIGYLALLAVLMSRVAYDVWGAFAALPVIAAIAIPATRRLLRGLPAVVQQAAMVGLAAKLAGTLARYWMAFIAYGGNSDAGRYHAAGKAIAGQFYEGRVTLPGLLPHTAGTPFVEEVTGFVYTLTGSSKLAGFLWFALLGYLGVVLTVKAAAIAVPELLLRRYAWLCFLMPSLVFWPSSIGKEAWMSLCLGAISLGSAIVYRGVMVRRAVPWIAAGALGSAMVRPHYTAIWLAAAVLALVWGVASGRIGTAGRHRRASGAAIAIAALIGLVVVGRFTLTYLKPTQDTGGSVVSQVTSIIDMTGERTSDGGSSFNPVKVNSPLDYPNAIIRTLTRPWVNEISSISSLLPGAETAFVLVMFVLNWRGFLRLPWLLARRPYVLQALLICMMFGIAFSSFSNLGILVRQRSLVMPAILLLACLPPAPRVQPWEQRR